MSPSLSIESVKAEFDRWRQQKKSPQCRTPEALKQKALALRSQHSKKDIIKALGISYFRLSTWESAMSPSDESAMPINPQFVPLTLDNPTETAVETHGLSITCEQSNGSRWQLQGHFTAQQLSVFVSTLGNLSGGRS